MTRARIDIPQEEIAEFCRRNRIQRLSLFGSVLRDDSTDESDVDVLVEFEEGYTPGLHFFGLDDKLSVLIGRRAAVHTPAFLSDYFGDHTIRDPEVDYAVAIADASRNLTFPFKQPSMPSEERRCLRSAWEEVDDLTRERTIKHRKPVSVDRHRPRFREFNLLIELDGLRSTVQDQSTISNLNVQHRHWLGVVAGQAFEVGIREHNRLRCGLQQSELPLQNPGFDRVNRQPALSAVRPDAQRELLLRKDRQL